MNETPTDLIERRRRECATVMKTDAARAAVALHGTPVLLLDPSIVVRQYTRLRDALPFVRFHYAVKACAHPAVIAALAEEGCDFDVASGEEIGLLDDHGVLDGGDGAERVIHTHPIKKAVEIREALAAGIRTFVVDNETELEKFREHRRAGVRLLVRLAYRSPHAGSDLSSKFGVDADRAAAIVTRADAVGLTVAGFSFHVGSQLDDPARFAAAIHDTAALMTRLEVERGRRFTVLDIGGGFPVAYDRPVAELEEVARAIRPALTSLAEHYEILAEPGRILVAESALLVTSIDGLADRPDGRWFYLDDGLYGSYSNVLTEGVNPLVFAERDLAGATGPRISATLAGPTCDSADVITRGADMPELRIGDLVVSPAMGAYTSVTATRFNGRPFTPVAVLTPVRRPAGAMSRLT
ncbi:type III PLP-dependent enzyme [Microbacterium sp. ET2]|uniref:type III PLP-dependent enzyme n=1 Tax=Microbacterium albipurpureum TaxID=3050384 RepID=UPI00259CCCC8|nr:type III PLP-dependent enzyme [Microbacterium sp. ET2 (Ac-2212)]WJL94873.1 type III PLP-dependent enzyme [Microbacterium sp. ET2 (Ac-2212)]